MKKLTKKVSENTKQHVMAYCTCVCSCSLNNNLTASWGKVNYRYLY